MFGKNIAKEMKEARLNDTEIELYALDNCLKCIFEGSTKLKCSISTRTKALLIYHHFKSCVAEVKYDDYLVAAACLSLSIKFNKEDVEVDAIIFAFYSIIERPLTSTKDKRLKTMRNSLTEMELIILRMTEFYLNHSIAHEYLVHFLNDIPEHIKILVWDVLTETCMRIACDFYLSNKCVTYKPDEIAIAVLYVALYLVGIRVFEPDCYLRIWFKALNDTSESKIYDIVLDFTQICGIGPIAESLKVMNTNVRKS